MSKLHADVATLVAALPTLATKDDISALLAKVDALTAAHSTTTTTVTDNTAAIAAIADAVGATSN